MMIVDFLQTEGVAFFIFPQKNSVIKVINGISEVPNEFLPLFVNKKLSAYANWKQKLKTNKTWIGAN